MSMYDVGMKTAAKPSNPSFAARQPCCSLVNFPNDAGQAERKADMFKALADPTRLQLLSHVADEGCDDVCACDITEELGITHPTVSQHMKRLVDGGLVTREHPGKWAHASVAPEGFARLRAALGLSYLSQWFRISRNICQYTRSISITTARLQWREKSPRRCGPIGPNTLAILQAHHRSDGYHGNPWSRLGNTLP